MASTTTIDLPFTGLVTSEEWGPTAYVYAPSADEFYITQEKHKALEVASTRKFEAKVSVKEGVVNIALPPDFARQYLWERFAQITKRNYGDKVAILVFVEKGKRVPAKLA